MSDYSGTNDLYDKIQLIGLFNVLNSKIYVDGNDKEIKLQNIKDCVKYYPYTVLKSVLKNGKNTIYLSRRDSISEEQEKFGVSSTQNLHRSKWKAEMIRCGYPKDFAEKWTAYKEV